MSSFLLAKSIFFDDEKKGFIKLETSIDAYDRIIRALNEEAASIILLYGPPGSGKSFMLSTIYNELKDSKEILFLRTPFSDQIDFLHQLFEHFLKKDVKELENQRELIDTFLREYKKSDRLIIFLDEVQLYDEKSLEFIRLLSDLRVFKFVLSLHKTQKEDIFTREYFLSRIWDSIELRRLNYSECAVYIQKKLLNNNLGEIAAMFDDKTTKLICKITNGSFRNINKLMCKTFDICDYFDKNRPIKFNSSKKISKKIIEMAAIDLGLIDV